MLTTHRLFSCLYPKPNFFSCYPFSSPSLDMEEMEGERRVRLNSETLREDHLVFSSNVVFDFTAVSKSLYIFAYVALPCKRLRSPGIDSCTLCSLAGRYMKQGCRTGPPGLELIPGLLKRFTNSDLEMPFYRKVFWKKVSFLF
jgi:hypothetical protein